MADERNPSVDTSNSAAARDHHTTEHGYVTAHDPCVDRTLLLPGMHVDRFVIQQEVGRGGFGIVYKALDPNLGRHVAIKVPRADFLTTPTDRLYREAKIVATLEHEGIVRVYEAGTDSETSFIVSQLCEGPDLHTWMLDRANRLSFVQAAELIAQLADALSYAHRHGVLHRDVKPGNVLLFPLATPTSDDEPLPGHALPFQPRLTDFGLASMQSSDWAITRNSVAIGTPLYMAPECFARGDQTPGEPADIYGLGAVLFELLIGKPPVRGEHFGQLLHSITNEVREYPHQLDVRVPIDLSIICNKCLRKDAEDRYASAGDLRDDLRRFLQGQPIDARVPTWRDRFAKWCQQPQRIRIAGASSFWFHLMLVPWLVGQLLLLGNMGAIPRDILVRSLIDAFWVSVVLHLPQVWLGYRLAKGSRWAFWPSAITSVLSLCVFAASAFSQQALFDYMYPSSVSKVATFSLLISAGSIVLGCYVLAIPAYLRSRRHAA